MDGPVVFTGSPRRGGNSDAAAGVIVRELEGMGRSPRLIHLRDTPLRPCLGCYGCRKDAAGRCVQPDGAKASRIYDLLMTAPDLYFTAPIYFYHLPGLFKDIIDRSQPYYLRREAREPDMLGLPVRTARVVLVAGRPRGKRLFEGAELTLRYFLHTFNVGLERSLHLRGIDRPGDLKNDVEACRAIRRMVREATD